MSALWVGALAFVIAFGFDLANMAGMIPLKRTIVGVSSLLFLLGFWLALREPPAIPAPQWVVVLGTLITALGLILCAYSLVIEIPFQSTYIAPEAPSRLVTTGTYALCRHPGVLWFALLLIGLLIASRSAALLVAAPVWLGLDILYVWLQDRYFFPQQFPDYPDYRKLTPMLLPTPASVRRCGRTLFWSRGRSPERGQTPTLG